MPPEVIALLEKLDTRTPKECDQSSAMQSNHKRGLVAPNVVGVQLRSQCGTTLACPERSPTYTVHPPGA